MITPRKALFITCYLKSHNGTESAKQAGYSQRTAYSQANRLLKSVDVKKRIEEAERDYLKEIGIESKEAFAKQTYLNWKEENHKSARARYWEMLGHVLQFIRPAQNVNVNYDTLNISYQDKKKRQSSDDVSDDKLLPIQPDDKMGDKPMNLSSPLNDSSNSIEDISNDLSMNKQKNSSDNSDGVAHPLEREDIHLSPSTPTPILKSVRNLNNKKLDLQTEIITDSARNVLQSKPFSNSSNQKLDSISDTPINTDNQKLDLSLENKPENNSDKSLEK